MSHLAKHGTIERPRRRVGPRSDKAGIPAPTVRRLPRYHALLESMLADGRSVVSCSHIARELSLSPIQVRKDMAAVGVVGRPRLGFPLAPLVAGIARVLNWDDVRSAVLIGVGHLGRALAGCDAWRAHGLELLAAFDIDPDLIGHRVEGLEVFALDRLADLVPRLGARIAVLCVPEAVAQETAAAAVAAGILALWNFTPVTLHVSDRVVVEDVRLFASLALLTNRLQGQLSRQPLSPHAQGATSDKEYHHA